MLSGDAGRDRVPIGFDATEHGHRVVNLKDAANTMHHADPGRLRGCRGLDGLDGMNVVCTHGHEVGTEQADCWVSHAVVFSRDAVWLDRIWDGDRPTPRDEA